MASNGLKFRRLVGRDDPCDVLGIAQGVERVVVGDFDGASEERLPSAGRENNGSGDLAGGGVDEESVGESA